MVAITKGKIERPQRVVIYGPEGIGKTTLASKFPKPIFIDTEDGTAHMDVDRVVCPKNAPELYQVVTEIALDHADYKTIVIDTADWAENIITLSRLAMDNKKSIEDYGYGKGYTIIGEDFQKLLICLDNCINHGMNVVITAHAKMRKFELPDEAGAFDRWEMKLSKQIAPMLKEWADMVIFCNYEINIITTENKSKKATGGKRMMFTSHHPCWDAKNRVGLPEKLPMDYEPLAPHIPASAPIQKEEPKKETTEEPKDDIRQKLIAMCKEKKVSKKELLDVCVKKKKIEPGTQFNDIPDELIQKWVVPHFDKIVEMVANDPNNLPF